MSFLNSQYYDYPEGQDAFGKVVATNKIAVATGLAYGTAEVLMVSKPKGYLPTLGRYAYFVGPMMGMATAFTLTTYAATNLRGKDDRWNYVLGGLAAGAIFGAWQRNHVAGCVAGMFLAIAGATKKTSKIEGWEFFPSVIPSTGSLNVEQHDFTIMKDPAKRSAK